MSVTQELNIEQVQPYYTSDEWILLQALDPKGKLRSEQYNEDINNQKQLGYSQMIEDDSFTNHGAPMDYAGSDLFGSSHRVPTGSGQDGGFAFLPFLAAAAPVIGSLLPPVIDGIAGLFKGKGVAPPNLRFGGNTAVTGAISAVALPVVVELLKERLPIIKQKEQQIEQAYGPEKIAMLKDAVKTEVKKIIKVLPLEGIDIRPTMAMKVANQIVDKQLPKSLDKFIEKPSKEIGQGQTALGVTVKPIVKWALHKLVKNAPRRKEISRKLKNISEFIDKSAEEEFTSGKGPYLDKLRGVSKHVLDKVLPEATDASLNVLSKIGQKYDIPSFELQRKPRGMGISPPQGGSFLQVAGLVGSFVMPVINVLKAIFGPKEAKGVYGGGDDLINNAVVQFLDKNGAHLESLMSSINDMSSKEGWEATKQVYNKLASSVLNKIGVEGAKEKASLLVSRLIPNLVRKSQGENPVQALTGSGKCKGGRAPPAPAWFREKQPAVIGQIHKAKYFTASGKKKSKSKKGGKTYSVTLL